MPHISGSLCALCHERQFPEAAAAVQLALERDPGAQGGPTCRGWSAPAEPTDPQLACKCMSKKKRSVLKPHGRWGHLLCSTVAWLILLSAQGQMHQPVTLRSFHAPPCLVTTPVILSFVSPPQEAVRPGLGGRGDGEFCSQVQEGAQWFWGASLERFSSWSSSVCMDTQFWVFGPRSFLHARSPTNRLAPLASVRRQPSSMLRLRKAWCPPGVPASLKVS